MKYFCFPAAPPCGKQSAVSNNPVFLFFNTPANPGPTVLRLTLAGIFLFHGAQRTLGLFGGPGWHSTLETWNSVLSLPSAVTWTVLVAELAIGVAFVFGFFTRLAALMATAALSAAVVIQYRTGMAYPLIEYPIVMLAIAISLVFLGAGVLSFDRSISKNLLPSIG